MQDLERRLQTTTEVLILTSTMLADRRRPPHRRSSIFDENGNTECDEHMAEEMTDVMSDLALRASTERKSMKTVREATTSGRRCRKGTPEMVDRFSPLLPLPTDVIATTMRQPRLRTMPPPPTSKRRFFIVAVVCLVTILTGNGGSSGGGGLVLVSAQIPPPAGSRPPSKRRVAKIDGDINLGALFPVHRQPSLRSDYVRQCGEIWEQYGMHRIEVFLRTLDAINANDDILPNVTLGCDIRDSCWYPPVALEQSIDFIKNSIASLENVNVTGPCALRRDKPIAGLIGPGSSTVTIQVHTIWRCGTLTTWIILRNIYIYIYIYIIYIRISNSAIAHLFRGISIHVWVCVCAFL